VIELSHISFLKEDKKNHAPGNLPRNSPGRIAFEQEVSKLVETRLNREPDLICLAGYDQWLSD